MVGWSFVVSYFGFVSYCAHPSHVINSVSIPSRSWEGDPREILNFVFLVLFSIFPSTSSGSLTSFYFRLSFLVISCNLVVTGLFSSLR